MLYRCTKIFISVYTCRIYERSLDVSRWLCDVEMYTAGMIFSYIFFHFLDRCCQSNCLDNIPGAMLTVSPSGEQYVNYMMIGFYYDCRSTSLIT